MQVAHACFVHAAAGQLGILVVHVKVLPPGHGLKVANYVVHFRAVEQASMVLVSIPPLLLPVCPGQVARVIETSTKPLTCSNSSYGVMVMLLLGFGILFLWSLLTFMFFYVNFVQPFSNLGCCFV